MVETKTRTIKEAVVRKYPEIGHDETLATAIKMMAASNVSALVVMHGDILLGIATITDVIHSLAHEQDPENTRIDSFMTKCELISGEGVSNPCAQLDEGQELLAAIKVMHQCGVNHLVVSGGDGNPVGVVSSLEIIKLLGS